MRRICGRRLLPSSKTQAPEPKSTCPSCPGAHSILRKGSGVFAPSLRTKRFTEEYEPVKPSSLTRSCQTRWADNPASSFWSIKSMNGSHWLGLPGGCADASMKLKSSSDPAVEMAEFESTVNFGLSRPVVSADRIHSFRAIATTYFGLIATIYG